jgi:phage-related protein (TIGR01555 family)
MSKATNVIPIFGDRMRKVAARIDGYVNAVTALGTARDKMSYNRFVRGRQLDTETLDSLYSENDIAARVCDVVPDEELRQGYDIVVAPDADDESGNALDDASSVSEDVHDAADALDLQSKFIEARVWGRVFGGGALLLGADDGATVENGRLKEPLNEKAIATFDHINVLDRRYMSPVTFYSDPTDPKFGKPKTFIITPQAASSLAAARAMRGTVEMHETRLVVFGGTRTSIRTRQANGGWDTSVLQRMNKTLEQFGVSWDALAHMLQDASQGIFKMRGFIDALAGNETSLVMQRLDMMDMARSVVRAVILDEEGESFERQKYSWQGVDKPYQMFMLRMAASARMPVTIMMGQSPAGMDATGESDIRWFYDTIRTSQTNEVKPALEYILRLIMLAKSGPTSGSVPDSWGVTFPSLWQPTPSEQADIEKKYAERDAIYLDRDVVTPEEIAVSRFTADGWRPDTQINLEERRAILEAGDLDDDIKATPTLDDPEVGTTEPTGGDDVAKQALNGAQTTALVDVATKVQNGELEKSSGTAIVLAAIPALSAAEAAAIVGEAGAKPPAAPVPPAFARPPAPASDEDEDEDEIELDDDERVDKIEKRGNKFVLLSTKGKVLGTHDTEAEAAAQERVIEESKSGE